MEAIVRNINISYLLHKILLFHMTAGNEDKLQIKSQRYEYK
jgi:hypothetical protein